MGNNNITSECCSDRNEREQKMVGRFERPEFYNQKLTQSSPIYPNHLANSSLNQLRQTYDKDFLKDVENTLLIRKSKGGKSFGSQTSYNVNQYPGLSERSGRESSTFGDVEKIQILSVQNQNSLTVYLKKEEFSNNVVLLPNFVVPNPLDHINEALIFFQNSADIKNLTISNSLLNHEYTEIRFKVINSDLEKEKKFIIGCLNSLSENHEFIGFFLNEKLEYILVFHKTKVSQKSPLKGSPYMLECLNNCSLSSKYLEESINSASKKNMEFKGGLLLCCKESGKYSWLLMYKRNTIVQKQYIVAVIDQLNLKVELKKKTLAKKIENLAEFDDLELIAVLSDFIEKKMIIVYRK